MTSMRLRCSTEAATGPRPCLWDDMDLQDLLRSLLRVAPSELVDDASAARAIVQIRWPQGPACAKCRGAAALHANALVCENNRCGARSSIFVGTSLGSLRRPRPRALLLALRAMATDARGISARALARSVNVPHVTIWRHIHRLRALLPGATATSSPVAFVAVCGRRREDISPASVGVRRGVAGFSFVHAGHGCASTNSSYRIVGEGVRTWLNGTFHGVTARYLPWYLHEATARSAHTPSASLAHALARLLAPPPRGA